MSGGSFDYLFIKDASDLFGSFSAREQLSRMVDELREFPDAADVAADAADALAIIDYQTVRLQAHLDRLKDVFHAVEWWRSCDWSKEQVNEAIANYRGEADA